MACFLNSNLQNYHRGDIVNKEVKHMKEIKIYHGSQNIIEQPKYGCGKKNNDFGIGFYCTENIELAKEWSVSSISNGFANKYTLNKEYLKILNLSSGDYTILNWIATLLEHRLFSIKYPVARKAKQYLIENFGVNVNAYDVVIGYRADDSYFDYAEAFINNVISVEQLAYAMQLGKLGEQIVLKSQYAFSNLTFEGIELASKEEFYIKRKSRNEEANKRYLEMLENGDLESLYIRDIIRKGITNDDSRIPRNVFE